MKDRTSKLRWSSERRLRGIVASAVIGAAGTAPAKAQRITLDPSPVRLTAIGGQAVTPVSSTAFNAQGELLIIGGPSRQEMFVVDSSGKGVLPPTPLAKTGAALGWPIAAAFSASADLLIVDAQSSRIAHLVRTGSGWRAAAVESTELNAFSSMCSAGGRTYIMAKRGISRDSGIVHEVTADGKTVRSFGRAFGDIPNPALGGGYVACPVGVAEIVVTSALYPEVRAYSRQGKLRWATRLAEFRPMGFRVEGRAIRFAYPPDSIWDQTISMFAAAPEIIAIQIGRLYGRNQMAPFSTIRTVLLSAASGDIVGAQADLPMVLSASRETLLTAEGRTPTELLLYRFHRKP